MGGQLRCGALIESERKAMIDIIGWLILAVFAAVMVFFVWGQIDDAKTENEEWKRKLERAREIDRKREIEAKEMTSMDAMFPTGTYK